MNNLLKVEIYNKNNILLGVGNYIFFDNQNNLIVKGYQKKSTLIAKANFTFKISIKNKKGIRHSIMEFKVFQSQFYENSDKMMLAISGEIIFTDDSHYIYNQAIIDIFKIWEKGEEINWRKFEMQNNAKDYILPFEGLKCKHIENSSLKESYIDACSLWQGRLMSINVNKTEYITIDGNEIKTKEDLFIILSEKLLGSRSYIGRNLDAFHDMLNDYYGLLDGKMPRIKIKNFFTLNKSIFSEKLETGNTYMEEIILSLRYFKFHVSLE